MEMTHHALRDLLALHFPLTTASARVGCTSFPASTHEGCSWVGEEVGADGEQEWAEHVASALLAHIDGQRRLDAERRMTAAMTGAGGQPPDRADIDRLAYEGYRTYWEEPGCAVEPWAKVHESDQQEWRGVVRAILAAHRT